MIKPSIAALALCAAVSSPVLAQPVNTITSARTGSAPTQTSVTKDGKICKALVVTGSRVPQQKICLTKEEWAAKADGSAKEAIDGILRSSLTNNRIPGT